MNLGAGISHNRYPFPENSYLTARVFFCLLHIYRSYVPKGTGNNKSISKHLSLFYNNIAGIVYKIRYVQETGNLFLIMK